MLPAIAPRLEPQDLIRRLDWLRRRLQFVTTFTGLFTVAAILIGGTASIGWLDWGLQLPALIRALILVALLFAVGWIAWNWLIEPLRRPTDNLKLALRLEEANPHLNDLLASAVEFIHSPGGDESRGSPLLRRITVRQALRESEACNFSRVINHRALYRSMMAVCAALLVAVPPTIFSPKLTHIALVRALAPFGAQEFPPRTELRITSPAVFPHRLALGESLEIRAEVMGAIPERATIGIWPDNVAPSEQTWIIERSGDNVGRFVARIEPSRVQRNLRIRVRANDADSGWLKIHVQPPPELAPLSGRPSPQIQLSFPEYAGLSPRELPDGASSWEAVAGTSVTLRAATSRPVARAWIIPRHDNPAIKTVLGLSPLGLSNVTQALAVIVASRTAHDPVPATIGNSGQLLEVCFLPWLSGTYALRFEDETAFGATRLLDIHVLPDPAPNVSMDRPSATFDSLAVTPNAELPLRAQILDSMFAVRSVTLEYHTQRGGESQTIGLFEHDMASRITATRMGVALQTPRRHAKLRLPEVHVRSTVRIADFRHSDGSPLRDGDNLRIQVVATDFDDVTPNKLPGRSHELTLWIVTPASLESLLQRDQARIRQELLKLQQWQREARSKASDALEHRDATGMLRPEDRERLLQAQQLQEQIRGRIGNQQEGLRADVKRLHDAERENKLPPSPSRDRMSIVGDELNRLAREKLESIEPLLHAAREEMAARPDEPAMNANRPNPLTEAIRRQTEVEKSLSSLLQLLERWGGANEVRGETRALLSEQERLQQLTAKLKAEFPTGVNRDRLTLQQQAELDRAAARQEAVAGQTRELLDKMDRLAEGRQEQARDRIQEANRIESLAKSALQQAGQTSDAKEREKFHRESERLIEQSVDQREAAANLHHEAETLRATARDGRRQLQPEIMAESRSKSKPDTAAGELRQNRLGNADRLQKESADAFSNILAQLEERREDDLNRLARKMRQAEEQLDRLADRQERLQKQYRQARQIANQEERASELERLAREQQILREESRDLAQELSRLQSKESAIALEHARREMADAQQRFQRGENADEAHDKILNRLDDAQDQLERSRERLEEELLRERIVKVANRVKGLRDRQDAAIKDAYRLHEKALKNKKWEVDMQVSLADLAETQTSLSTELDGLIEKRFRQDKVIATLLDHARDAMQQASENIRNRHEDIKNRTDDEPIDPKFEERLQAAMTRPQKTALRRLDQFLDAVKPDKEMTKQTNAGGKKPGELPSGRSMGESDALPPLAQLRVLRSLHAEVTERTEKFAQAYPDMSTLTEEQRSELTALQKLQRDVAGLVQEFAPADESKGDRP